MRCMRGGRSLCEEAVPFRNAVVADARSTTMAWAAEPEPSMTIVRGVEISASTCCGAQYAFQPYVSMNFQASEYWTDGWREHSLMPNDEGLRRCQCGQYVLVKDMVHLGSKDSSELPRMDRVPDDQLPECIARVVDEALEVAARLGYWRYLNHSYRDRYRQHRDAEEAATKAEWVALHPDRRTWWDRLRGLEAPTYSRPPGSPFTYPAFEATDQQRQNMQRLSEILQDWVAGSREGYVLELAELYREQGHFEDAARVIETCGARDAGATSQLISRLVKERQTAPVRYMG